MLSCDYGAELMEAITAIETQLQELTAPAPPEPVSSDLAVRLAPGGFVQVTIGGQDGYLCAPSQDYGPVLGNFLEAMCVVQLSPEALTWDVPAMNEPLPDPPAFDKYYSLEECTATTGQDLADYSSCVKEVSTGCTVGVRTTCD
ncbi:hypothetical protein BaRGS_00021572 [Batillaria attramentaria]|uniref:Uncharacterized protein n=1 Tax=Batillaria attramentaria TaxID=370345 RepID=A0ABD0KJK5_9CAEN